MPLECVCWQIYFPLDSVTPHPTPLLVTYHRPSSNKPRACWFMCDICCCNCVCTARVLYTHTVWVIRFCSGILEAGRPSLGLFFCVCGGLANLWISFQGSCITSTQPSVYSLTHALSFIPSAFSAFLFFVSLQPLSLRNIVCFLITCTIFCPHSIWNVMLKFRFRSSHTNECLLLFILIKICCWCCCLCNVLHSHGLYQGEGKKEFCWK